MSRPLQWAVQNKHVECVKAMLELYPESTDMNVLDKNGFGKSAVTDVRLDSRRGFDELSGGLFLGRRVQFRSLCSSLSSPSSHPF